MAFHAFLWIDGIAGNSSDSEHKNWIEITAFNIAATQAISRTASSAGDAAVGRVHLSQFCIVKQVDSASPKMLQACCSGERFKKIATHIYRAGGEKQKYVEYSFEDVIISGIHSGNNYDPIPSSFPEEVVWFEYAKANMVYSQQNPATGLIIGNVYANWGKTHDNTYA
jgi:type VI secretion system secreted protein Hcp